MSLAILFHFLCAQHVSDINLSIIKSLRLCCSITTSVFLFSVRCVLDSCASAWNTSTTKNQPHQISNPQRTEKKLTDVGIQQHSHKLLKMDILMSETCWAHKKWNKIPSDIELVFHSSTMYRGLYNNHPVLSDCNKSWNFSRDFRKIFIYQISQKSVQRWPNCSMRTDGRTGRHDETNSPF